METPNEPTETPAPAPDETENPTPAPAPEPKQEPEPPPGTEIVIEGKKTEREIELEKQLDANQRLIKDREMTIAEREAEIQRLKEVPKPPKVKRRAHWSDPVFAGGENE